VDEAAYYHDLFFAKHGDTKTRNELCDKSMLQDLSGIYNPRLREKLERGIVSSIINAKANQPWLRFTSVASVTASARPKKTSKKSSDKSLHKMD